jgi:hypothetical protein
MKGVSIMKHTLLKRAAAVSAMICSLIALPVRTSASSIEDVYDAMRRIGFPESMIQDAMIKYQNTEHDDEGMTINGTYFTYDVWADMVELYEDEIWEEVGKQFGVSGEEIKAAAQKQQAAEAAASAEQPGEAPAVTEAPAEPEPVYQTDKPFVNMTLEEKQAFVASLPEDERAEFLASLSTAERNSIIKQMSTDSQANIASSFIDLGEQLGMHISVDQLDENGISYSVRNSDGTLIDMSSIGLAVDNTGWDTTMPVLCGGALILGAAGGLWLVIRKMHREERSQ